MRKLRRRIQEEPLLRSMGWVVIGGFLGVCTLSLGAVWLGRTIPAAVSFVIVTGPICAWAALEVGRRRHVRQASIEQSYALEAPLQSVALVYPVIFGPAFDTESICSTVSLNAVCNPGVSHIILFDLADSDTKVEAGDEAILRSLRSAIDVLQSDLREAGSASRVLLLPRGRTWSPSQGKYIGADRKRGKIDAFIRLCGGGVDSFASHEPVDFPVDMICVLDDGAVLSQGSAEVLRHQLSLPYNRTRFGAASPSFRVPADVKPLRHERLSGRVRRAGSATPSRVFREYGEDAFLGQGAIVVKAYEQRVLERIPSESVLSHDKLEGYHLRVLSVPEAVIEDMPPRLRPARRAARERWARGDTLLLPWAFGSSSRGRSRLLPHQRWLILLDVIRVLQAPCFVVGFLALSLMPGTGALAMALVVLYAAPALLNLQGAWRIISSRSTERTSAWTLISRTFGQAGLLIADAAGDAYVSATGFVRGVVRLASGKRVLDWTSSSSLASRGPGRVYDYVQSEMPSVSLGIVLLATQIWGGVPDLPIAVVSGIWIASPLIGFYMDRAS